MLLSIAYCLVDVAILADDRRRSPLSICAGDRVQKRNNRRHKIEVGCSLVVARVVDRQRKTLNKYIRYDNNK